MLDVHASGVLGSVAVGPDKWGGTGLFAGVDCACNDVVSSIPLQSCLCVQDSGLAPEHHRGSTTCEVNIHEVHEGWRIASGTTLPVPLMAFITDTRADKVVRLAAWLAWLHRNTHPTSTWAAWTHSLPCADQLPLLGTLCPAAASALHFQSLVRRAAAERAERDAQWHSLPPGAAPAREDFEWALSLVSSRCYMLVDREGRRYACMAPVHDLANHRVAGNNLMFVLATTKQGPAHCYVATTAIAAGSELCICYGRDKSSSLLLSSYGFLVAGNLADRVPLGQRARWGDMNCIEQDVRWLDACAWRTLQARGVALGSCSATIDMSEGGVDQRRWVAAAISVMEGLAEEALRPTVLPPSAQEPSVGELQRHMMQRVLARVPQYCADGDSVAVQSRREYACLHECCRAFGSAYVDVEVPIDWQPVRRLLLQDMSADRVLQLRVHDL